MQFVNNDMDELFRKAAEDYPLHTKGNDWDKVLEKMEKDESSTGRRKQKGHAKWLLLLLPLFFICNRFSYVDHDAAVTSIKTSGERIPKTDDKTVAATASAENKLLKATSTHGPVSKQEVLLSTIEGRGINLSGGSTEDKLPEQKKPTSTRNIALDDYGSLSKTTKQVKENGSASGAPAFPATS
ncbi:MAG TPA: hypothetical protein VM935_08845, partial [Chitinophagaceae bacterium]|nr:hypothetical protein [Chitinophagaceae bacterium]